MANYYHIVVRNAAGIRILGNTFGYIFDHEYGDYAEPNAAVSIDNAKDIEISGNTCPDGIDMNDWISAKNYVDLFIMAP